MESMWIGERPSVVRRSFVLAACALTACASDGGGFGRGGGGSELARAPEVVPPPAHALWVRFGGLDALLADPRDAGLRRALGLLDERLIELPAELEQPVPPGIVELAIEILSSPWELTMDVVEGGDWTEKPPIRAQLTIHCKDAEAARSLYARIAPFSVLAPFPSALVEGEQQLKTMQLPSGELTFGTPSNSDLFLFAWGEPTLAPPAPGSLGLPRGVEPALALEADLGKLREPLEFFLAREDDTAEVRAFLEWLGILGPDPLAVSLAVGHGADRTHVATRYRNWKKIAARQGSLAAEPLSAAELRMVPADATFASLQRLDPLFLVDLLDLFADIPGGAPRDKLEAFLGLDLEADLLGPLGRTFGLYMSDTTGGGGLASIVVFAAVEERAKLDETIAHGIETLHALVQGETEGRFRIREWEHAGAACRSLSFPGIPIPFEVSLATSETFLFLASTPAGLAAALDQAQGHAPGLPAHTAFRGLGGGALDGLQALRFSDTPRLLADGYGLASLAASAIANGVRSRTDPAREPGQVLPQFHELADASRPSILLSRIQGDDLVVVSECDGSVVANATAWLGGAGSYVVGLGMLASAALPAVMVRRMESLPSPSTEYTRALADIITIHDAANDYAIENYGRYPASIEALVTPDEHGRRYLDRDSVPLDPWGRPYQYEPVGEGRTEPRVFSLGPDGVVSQDDLDQGVAESGDFDWADVDSGG